VCFAALRAYEAAYVQHKESGRFFYFAFVIAVDMETAGVLAGAGELVKLDTVHARIVKILR